MTPHTELTESKDTANTAESMTNYCLQYTMMITPVDAQGEAIAEELQILEEVLWQLDGFLSNSLRFNIHELLTGFNLLFSSGIDQNAVALHIKELFSQYCPTLLALSEGEKTWSKIESQDWEDKWKAFWHATYLLPNLVVCPSWEISDYQKTADPNTMLLELDPGMAFGTGSHETTRLVLTLMYDYFVLQQTYCNFETMIDVGTGSGILALYAAKLGFNKIIGIDNDPIAERVCMENAAKNSLPGPSQSLLFETSTLEAWQDKQQTYQTFDLVTANIILPVIQSILPELVKTTRPDGLLIISGILKSQLDILQDALNLFSDELVLLSVVQYGEWLGFVCRRKTTSGS